MAVATWCSVSKYEIPTTTVESSTGRGESRVYFFTICI